jgi:phosphoribosylanthranilate isomerase
VTTKIKICGVTQPANAAAVAASGVDFVGLNFWPQSKRYVAPEQAGAIADAIRGAGPAQIVGVFVDGDADTVAAVMAHVDLDIVQLHGDESPAETLAVGVAAKRSVWKAFAARAETDFEGWLAWDVDALLLDAPSTERGGSGRTFDWMIAADARRRLPAQRLVLAGGLSPENVASAIAATSPWAVDVASGVESAPGIKDPARVAAFVAAARGDQSR